MINNIIDNKKDFVFEKYVERYNKIKNNKNNNIKFKIIFYINNKILK